MSRALEACCLAAIVVVPLLFNVQAQAVFEPEKAALLQVLLLVLCALGLLSWASGGRPSHERLRALFRHPLGLAFSLTLLSYAFSTLFSVDPRLAMWGSYVRGQGLFSAAAYLAVFLAIFWTLKSEDQLRRLMQAMVLASVPVAVYGLFQAWEMDPVLWGSYVGGRIHAQAGNPIFLGAYLIMVIPVALALGAEAIVRARRGQGTWGPAAVYAAVAILLVGTAFLTESRGPLLGLLAGLSFLALLALRWTRPRAARRALAALSVLLVSVVVLVLPAGPLEDLRESPAVRWAGLHRFSALLDGGSSSVAVRRLLWDGMLETVQDDPARLLVGHGPETQVLAHAPHYRPHLARMEGGSTAADRAHNRTYDLLVAGGLPAFAVDLLLVGGLLWIVLRGLGVAETRTSRRWLLSCTLGGALLGGVAPWVLGTPWLVGPLLPVAALAGVFVFLAGDLVVKRAVGPGEAGGASAADQLVPSFRGFLLLGLGAAAVAHFVESQVGIETVTTRLYLWAGAGLVAAATLEPVGPAAADRRSDREWGREWGLVGGLTMGALSFGFVTAAPGTVSPVPLFAAAAGGAWLAGAMMLADRGKSALGGYAWVSFSAFVALLIAQVLWVGLGGSSAIDASVPTADLVRGVGHLSWTLPVFSACVLGVVLVFASGVTSGSSDGRTVYGRSLATAALAALVVLPVAWFGPLAASRADVFAHYALLHQERGMADRAALLYGEAVRIRPFEPGFHALAARTIMDVATRHSAGEDDRRRTTNAALAAATRARDLRPLDPLLHQALGALEAEAGVRSRDPEERELHYQQAELAFGAAVAIAPTMPGIWTAWGQVNLRMGEPEKAIERLERSRELEPSYRLTDGALGEAYLRLGLWNEAQAAYRRAVDLGVRDVMTYLNLALALGELGRFPLAIAYAERALEVGPPATKPEVRRLLRRLRAMSEGDGTEP